ncbi:helix-turn-helix transcriptional regulator [Tranquillimonas alkanivorans]|uniref:helix-turn-helix transcriptional regulator n=1 Tax=Tranquillimonas alkanivorans TaxID=441119 RepID=UPI000B84F703|nr:helix-turn-helix transcriptional regulator [Tranquillimonas alkanivorans]
MEHLVRPLQPYAAEAVALLGAIIRNNRIQARQTVAELASRAGISRGTLQRIERGDPGVSIGTVFEVCALQKISLFDLELKGIQDRLHQERRIQHLIPKSARKPHIEVLDDF